MDSVYITWCHDFGPPCTPTPSPPIIPTPTIPLPGAPYSYRATLTVDHTKVSNTDQPNFLVLVDIMDNALKTVANGGAVTNVNGYDVNFFTDAGATIPLKYGVISYDGTAGRMRARVNITLSHTSDTVFYAFIGNASITSDQSDKAHTLDANLKAYWPLEALGGDIDGTEWTGTHNGTVTNATSVPGQVGRGALFDANGEYIESSAPFSGGVNFTLEFWVQPQAPYDDGTGNIEYAFSQDFSGSPSTQWFLKILGEDRGGFGSGGAINFYTDLIGFHLLAVPEFNLTDWFHVAIAADSVDSRLYINGAPYDMWAALFDSTHQVPSSVFRMGHFWANYMWFRGILDEVRISNIKRTADWVETSYNNESVPGTFLHSVFTPITGTPTATPTYTTTTHYSYRYGFSNRNAECNPHGDDNGHADGNTYSYRYGFSNRNADSNAAASPDSTA